MVSFRSGVGYRGGCTSRLTASDRARGACWVPPLPSAPSAILDATGASGETHMAMANDDGIYDCI